MNNDMKNNFISDFLKNKKILITGGLGFIGSNLAIKLSEYGSKIILVDSMIPEYGGNLFNITKIKDKVNINFSDVRDEYSMNFLIRDVDVMFNFAGQVSHIDSMNNPYIDLEINTKSQISILEACRKYNPKIKIVFASTRQIYGKPEYLPVDEKHPLSPIDINGVNKLAGEWYHAIYHNVYGIKTVCLRLTNTYGPRLLVKHNRQGFIGWFIRRVIEGKEIEIYGDGKQLRDLNYIDDCIQALLISACDDSLNGQIFNLGNHPPITLENIAKLIIKINGSGSYRFVSFSEENKKIDIGHYYASYDKFKNMTGWEPKISYEEGLAKTWLFYKENKEYYW